MARLNESTTSTESVEILKRRFVRQNREIARVNSIQSLRIRGLEAEVSQLLSENVSLREQVIALNQELERFGAAKTLQDGVYDMKGRLDSKLGELSELVAELGALPRQFSKTCHSKSDPEYQRPSRESIAGVRHHESIAESSFALEGDGRLPIILEDKYYPRKTFEPQELQQLNESHDSLESSGQEYNATEPSENHAEVGALLSDPADGIAFPSTLETRKRKKLNSRAMDGDSNIDSAPCKSLGISVKCGAKRKFSAEDQEIFESAATDDDGFQFSRPSQPPPLKLVSETDHSLFNRELQFNSSSIGREQHNRKVLEPKCTNINISSPNKARNNKARGRHGSKNTSSVNENTDPDFTKFGKGISYEQDVSSEKPMTIISSSETDELGSDVDLVDTKSTVPSPFNTGLQQQEDVTGAMDGTLNIQTRPSRRQRAIVSYAEPNLRDKMRRPTNEFIAAVGGDKSKSSGSQTTQSDTTRERGERKSGSITVRKSQCTDSIDLEPSCILMDIPEGDLGRQMNMISQRKRNTSSIGKSGALGEANVAGHLVKDKRRSLVGTDSRIQDLENPATSSKAQTNDVTSDCGLAAISSGRGRPAETVSSTYRQSRRHSSNTTSTERGHTCQSGMMISDQERDLIVAKDILEPSIHEMSARQVSKIQASTTDYQVQADTLDGKQIRRGYRAASRRRSMML